MSAPHIEQFIERFKYGFDHNALKECFTKGNCYHFAVILKNIYKDGEIVEDVMCNHFMLRLDGKYYDITGQVFPCEQYIYKWGEFDKVRDKRVERQCVFLEDRMFDYDWRLL